MDDLKHRMKHLRRSSEDDEKRAKRLDTMGAPTASLRDYQLFGIKWLVCAHEIAGQYGCILGDEMGLGKTVQVMCMKGYYLNGLLFLVDVCNNSPPFSYSISSTYCKIQRFTDLFAQEIMQL